MGQKKATQPHVIGNSHLHDDNYTTHEYLISKMVNTKTCPVSFEGLKNMNHQPRQVKESRKRSTKINILKNI